MTRSEAEAECERLQRTHPDRHTHRWRAVELVAGEWTVAKVNVPPVDVGTPTVESRPKPPTPEDPRPDVPPSVGPF
jgi:hypothetical protein